MEERKCFYCNETMNYGPQTQIMCLSVVKDGRQKFKSVKFIQYGWRCPMKDDACDVVFDEKDMIKNDLLAKNAIKKL
jgi:hypothetical protein